MASNKSSTGSSLIKTKIKRIKRDVPPAHYILKIKSFSHLLEILMKTRDSKYVSDEFEVGDYKWKLVVYPKGNEKGNGKGHISMYVASTDKKAIGSGCHVNALVNLFVYDHIRDKYLTVQDGKMNRYHGLRSEHGYDQFLSLVKFNDLSKGYLFNDCCVFGAEVHVIKNTLKVNEFSVIKDPQNATWKIDKFSTFQNEYYNSDTFNAGGYTWNWCFYPRGVAEGKDSWLSLFLGLDNDPTNSQGVYAEYLISVKDQLQGKNHQFIGGRHFRSLGKPWGC